VGVERGIVPRERGCGTIGPGISGLIVLPARSLDSPRCDKYDASPVVGFAANPALPHEAAARLDPLRTR
jgi:hypothetical protein